MTYRGRDPYPENAENPHPTSLNFSRLISLLQSGTKPGDRLVGSKFIRTTYPNITNDAKSIDIVHSCDGRGLNLCGIEINNIPNFCGSIAIPSEQIYTDRDGYLSAHISKGAEWFPDQSPIAEAVLSELIDDPSSIDLRIYEEQPCFYPLSRATRVFYGNDGSMVVYKGYDFGNQTKHTSVSAWYYPKDGFDFLLNVEDDSADVRLTVHPAYYMHHNTENDNPIRLFGSANPNDLVVMKAELLD